MLSKNLLKGLTILFLLLVSGPKTFAHCEIPCGIYHDHLRIELISEHIETIEKSMNMINELSAEGEKNYNQLVRWIVNKEEHALKIQDIVSQYFLHQRVKITDMSDETKYEKYVEQLTLLHQLSVYSMKAKQTTDLQHIENLRSVLSAFEDSYFEGKEEEHEH